MADDAPEAPPEAAPEAAPDTEAPPEPEAVVVEPETESKGTETSALPAEQPEHAIPSASASTQETSAQATQADEPPAPPMPPAEDDARPASSDDAKVVFRVEPEGFTHPRSLPVNTTVEQARAIVSGDLGIALPAIGLRTTGSTVDAPDNVTLASLGAVAGQAFEVSLNVRSSQAMAKDHAALPAIDVEVVVDGQPRLVQVSIDRSKIVRKPFLGGYRHKKTEVVYNHASTQTERKPRYTEADRKLSRETQTHKHVKRSQQSTREFGTQMARPDLLLADAFDREVIPGPYMTAEALDRLREQKAIIIQCHVRGWFARRLRADLRKAYTERLAYLAEQEARMVEQADDRRRREIDRRMRPRKAEDFEILYNELEAWRLQEAKTIKEAHLPKEDEDAALRQLLFKETKLLQTIDRLKQVAAKENSEARIQKSLSSMSEPKKWELANGTTVHVHTPFTTRAKELMQLYNGLKLPLLTTDERLDVLLHVKWTVKEFDCNLTREIVELVDREADLLNRGRSVASLEGLRKRLANLFLQFVETPEFNPEATRQMMVPGEASV